MNKLQPIATICCFLMALLLAAHEALPQTSAQNQIAELSSGAMQDYDFMEFAAAESKISQAIELIEFGKIKEPYTAQVYLAQGIISYGYLKDSALAVAEEKAFASFVRACSIDPNVDIPTDYKSPELEAILERAKNTVGSSGSIVTSSAKPSISHTGITSTQLCSPLTVEAQVPPHPDVYRVKLFYLSDDEKSYKSLDMSPSVQTPDILSATIPASDTNASRIKYYIEALNRQNQPVAAVASISNPLQTVTMGECNLEDSQYGSPIFQLSALIGTGLAVIEGMTEKCPSASNCQTSGGALFNGVGLGVAPVPLFARADLTFNLPKNFQIGAYARIQIIEFAYMFGGFLRYVFMQQPYRLYLGVMGGWGDATATINLGPQFQNFRDIYRLKGPGHAGLQFGFLLSLHKNVGLAFDLTALVHFPKKVNFQAEIAIGPFIQF